MSNFDSNFFISSLTDKASVSKVMLGSLAVSHIAMNLGALSNLQKYMVCKIPGTNLHKSKTFFKDIVITIFISFLMQGENV